MTQKDIRTHIIRYREFEEFVYRLFELSVTGVTLNSEVTVIDVTLGEGEINYIWEKTTGWEMLLLELPESIKACTGVTLTNILVVVKVKRWGER